MMKKKSSDFDEFFVVTVLADLFDSTGSDDPDFVAQGADADEADAIISAAALRYFSRQKTSQLQTMFDLSESIAVTARKEGWIFGVQPR